MNIGNDALVAQKLDHLVATAESDDPADNSILAKLVSKAATADWSDFANTTDSLEALRDRGDAAWVTATGFEPTGACAAALVAVNLDHLVYTATGIPAVTSGTFLDIIMRDGTATWDRTTDSLQALRDRGDAAWVTATGFATPTNVTDAVSAIEVYGAAHWVTATGFATPTNVSDAQTAITNAISALNDLSVDEVETAIAADPGLVESLKWLKADHVVVTTDDEQWRLSIREAGTATVLGSKDFAEVDGTPITTTEQLVGQEVETP